MNFLTPEGIVLVITAVGSILAALLVARSTAKRAMADATKVLAEAQKTQADAQAVVAQSKISTEIASVQSAQSVNAMLHGEILLLQQRIASLEAKADAGRTSFEALALQYQQSLVKVVSLEVEIGGLKREVANLRGALGTGQGGVHGVVVAENIMPAGTGIEGKEQRQAVEKAEAVVAALSPEAAAEAAKLNISEGKESSP
jgi:chromosome segregation ATPase